LTELADDGFLHSSDDGAVLRHGTITLKVLSVVVDSTGQQWMPSWMKLCVLWSRTTLSLRRMDWYGGKSKWKLYWAVWHPSIVSHRPHLSTCFISMCFGCRFYCRLL